MRIRLIGLGDTGEELVFATCLHFAEQGLNGFLERRLVVKSTTAAYAGTFGNLRLVLTTNAPTLATDNALVTQQWAVAQLFFGGRDADMESRWDTIVLERNQGAAPEEQLAAARFFRRLRRDLSPAAGELYFRHLSEGFTQHVAAVRQPALPGNNRVENIGPDWLIVPTMPLTEQLVPQLALIGQQLATAIPETDFRRGRLVQGLGVADSLVDVVVLVFSLNDTFAAEGARVVCEHVRRALQPQEANRIVAVLGFGVYEVMNAAYPAGRYLGEHFRLRRSPLTFDGLLTSPNTAALKQNFAATLAAIAVSSTPETVQIDNPDANQVQRDFGRSLVGFGYAEGDQTALNLYAAAKNDWTNRHCEPDAQDGGRTAVRDNFDRQLQALQAAGLPVPAWANHFTGGGRGDVERATARKVVLYLGHDDRLQANDLQDLRRQLEQDFPRARTVIYKYELLPPVRPEPPGPRGLARLVGHLLKPLGMAQPEPLPQATVPPRPLHLVMFVVDCFETRAVGCFADFVRWSLCAVNPQGALVPPGVADDRWGEQKRTVLARGLLDYPNAAPAWPFNAHGVPQLRSLLTRSILGGSDDAACAAARIESAQWLGREADPPVGTLQTQSGDIENTVGRAQTHILSSLMDSLVKAEWAAEVILGLHVLCNEQVARRRVSTLVADLALQARQPPAPQPAAGPAGG